MTIIYKIYTSDIHLSAIDMANPALFALVTLGKALSWNEAASGVFGSISLATWVFLLV